MTNVLRRWAPFFCVALLGFGGSGCGASAEEQRAKDERMLSDWEARTKAMDATEGGEAPPEVTASAPAAERLSTGTIDRAELVPWLSAGLGRFLQRVEVEAVTEGGKFVGFRIVAIDAQGTGLEKVDLLPGDVITSVNQQPVERPEQATQVWESLKSAPELVVHYLRDGQVRQLHFTIVDAKTKG